MVEMFTYSGLPVKVRFGFGTLATVAEEVRLLGCKRALVLSTPQQVDLAEETAKYLGELSAGTFTEAAMHTPVDVTERAMAVAKEAGADCVVSVGGGSTTGLGKAIALRTDMPQIVVPTSYAGSEATPILGQTEGGEKTTQRTMKVLPEVIIYDVNLTMTLPQGLSATSGMNAIAHAVEALYAKDSNPVTSMLAEQGIAAFARALPLIRKNLHDKDARADALLGAWLCGTCLGTVGMSLHHKICHTLGGTFNLPHAETHAIVLSHSAAYNSAFAKDAMARVARALGTPDAATGLYDLLVAAGAPTALKDIGMPEDGLDRAADIAAKNPYWNPRPIERNAIRELLDDAYFGRRPKTQAEGEIDA
jgi:maleylacetate reductase